MTRKRAMSLLCPTLSLPQHRRNIEFAEGLRLECLKMLKYRPWPEAKALAKPELAALRQFDLIARNPSECRGPRDQCLLAFRTLPAVVSGTLNGGPLPTTRWSIFLVAWSAKMYR